jgi:ketosteroid isomerase-like protein
MREENREVARRAYEAYARGDVAGASKAFAADAVIYGPVGHGEFETVNWTNRGGFAAFIAQISKYWRIASYEVIRLEAEGDWVTAFIRMSAVNWTTDQVFTGITINVLRFRNGLCVEFHEMVDRDKLIAAAGVGGD